MDQDQERVSDSATLVKMPVQMSISAIITRADGTIEDLGVISYHHRNPLRMLSWRFKNFLRKKFR